MAKFVTPTIFKPEVPNITWSDTDECTTTSNWVEDTTPFGDGYALGVFTATDGKMLSGWDPFDRSTSPFTGTSSLVWQGDSTDFNVSNGFLASFRAKIEMNNPQVSEQYIKYIFAMNDLFSGSETYQCAELSFEYYGVAGKRLQLNNFSLLDSEGDTYIDDGKYHVFWLYSTGDDNLHFYVDSKYIATVQWSVLGTDLDVGAHIVQHSIYNGVADVDNINYLDYMYIKDDGGQKPGIFNVVPDRYEINKSDFSWTEQSECNDVADFIDGSENLDYHEVNDGILKSGYEDVSSSVLTRVTWDIDASNFYKANNFVAEWRMKADFSNNNNGNNQITYQFIFNDTFLPSEYYHNKVKFHVSGGDYYVTVNQETALLHDFTANYHVYKIIYRDDNNILDFYIDGDLKVTSEIEERITDSPGVSIFIQALTGPTGVDVINYLDYIYVKDNGIGDEAGWAHKQLT